MSTQRSLLTLLLLAVAFGQSSGAARADEDPDLFKPQNTTGGAIGAAVGLILTPEFGPEMIPLGATFGHGIDRLSTRIANDVTGPAWKEFEQGPVGRELGNLGASISRSWKKVIK